MHKFGKIPIEALRELKTYLAQSCSGTSGWSAKEVFRSATGDPACDGVLRQIGVATAFLVDTGLLQSMKVSTVQQYALRFKTPVRNTPGIGCYCEDEDCKVCHSPYRPDLMTIVHERWYNALQQLWDDGLCLDCVQEDRPFSGYHGPCRIH